MGLTAAVDDLLARFADRWPGYTFDDRRVWLHAMRRAPADLVRSAAVDAVTLDDRPPSAHTVARRIAGLVAAQAEARDRIIPDPPPWHPDPGTLASIRAMRDAQAAAARRITEPLND